MGMSEYYKNLREKIGNQLIFMPSVAGIIRNEQGEILFGRKHNEENWGLIAGAIEIGETPAQAMVREASEETGLDIEPERIIGVYGGEEQRFTYGNGHQVEYLAIVFECKIKDGQLNSNNEEMKELKFFPEDQIPPIVNKYPDYIFSSSQEERAHFIK
ncbi:NUDIX domain-containing protein [Paenibacillus macerans]|uniref:NUDIX domain-containing protein n=1 Tax=Paenibacillus macerans TaxID=44252 RepID=UPI002DBDBA25|nr:NUDIX domain-containing protein [Paenibacillus macerans]MEC0329108.1 NUDIX domain-containing protein [Paenibacillus macerans]MED4954257.1 NUDIX domain-containing protein [Paenibacillus macerans]